MKITLDKARELLEAMGYELEQAEQEPDDLDWITPEAVFEAKLKLHGIPNPPVREKNK